MPKKSKNSKNDRLSEATLLSAWSQIRSKRELALEKAKKIAKELEDQVRVKINVGVYESDLGYKQTLVLEVCPKWPDVSWLNKFIAGLKKTKFILPDNKKRIIEGYFYCYGKKATQGYYLYVKEPVTFGAGC